MANEDKLRAYLKKAATDLHGYRERVAALESRAHEPIAIIGMACRFPGSVDSPEALWQLVADRGDAITGFPGDRGWDVERLYKPDHFEARGGFVDGAADFDPDFFGISPREAVAMDPQQRLLLEGTWRAFEDARLDAATLRGSRTGVFTGAMYHEYGTSPRAIPEAARAFIGTGTAGSVMSGRLSYVFGLEGPAVSVDTACSSSLVALHLAVQSLRAGECELAVAGAATVMVTPTAIADFAFQGNIGSGAQCKAFAEAADGTGLSEGMAVLVVERLADALRNGHPIAALIRGSAVNQDGASNGLTAPNGPSQQRVIRAALANARVEAASVDAVEAHGTGTALGDPIEAQALIAAYGDDRDAPLYLGSVKSNIGHTQAAAGLAGVVKMVSAMQQGTLPATLHVDEPSHSVDWSAGTVELLTRARPWPEQDGRGRRAAVSSFGISGTNAHVVLEAAPAARDDVDEQDSPFGEAVPWTLSARSAPALQQLAADLVTELDEYDDAAEIARTLSTRGTFDHRAVLTSASMAERLAALRALAATGTGAGTARTGGTAALFTGQGAQHHGMGRDLRETFAVYREAFDAACAAFDGLLPVSLADVILADDDARLHRTGCTQPALFAVETALFRLLESVGVRPRLLAGHSVGEITAAHVAGVLSLTDAATLVAARAQLMDALPEGGAMLAVEGSEADAAVLLTAGIDLAAVNGPRSVVLSGDGAAIDAAEQRCRADGVRCKRLTVSHAFHSALMEPMLEPFRAVVAKLDFRAPRTTIVSTVTGRVLGTDELADPGYWASQVRRPVRFTDALQTLADAGPASWVEVGPDAALTAAAAQSDVTVAPLLRRDRPALDSVLDALATLYRDGEPVAWSTLVGAGRLARLPGHPFLRTRFWLDPVAGGDVTESGLEDPGHPLLAAGLRPADTDHGVLTARLSTRTQPWLADHVVAGTPLLPGTAMLEAVATAGREFGCGEVAELTLTAPLLLDAGDVDVQIAVGDAAADGHRDVTLHGRIAGTADWTLHASGSVRPGPAPAVDTDEPAEGIPVDVEDFYADLEAQGIAYGHAFRGLTAARLAGELDAHCDIELPDGLDATGWSVHPALLDAALQSIALLQGDEPALPFAFTAAVLRAPSGTGLRSARVRARRTADGVAVRVIDRAGLVVADIAAVAVRTVDPAAMRSAAVNRALHVMDLVAVEQGTPVAVHDTLPETDVELAAVRVADAQTALPLLQDFLTDTSRTGRLVLVTRDNVDGATVSGLAGSAQAEHPGRVVVVRTDGTADTAAAEVVTGPADEPQLVLRDGTLLAPRLVRRPLDAGDTEPWTGRVLITGGTGALGRRIARHLVTEHGVRDLLLVSRRGADAPGTAELIGELQALGADARVTACDTTDAAAVAELFATATITGIVHAQGVLADATLPGLTADSLRTVLAAKLDAARLLDAQSRDGSGVTRFVLFSSVAGVFGAAGQGNYAAANRGLDALAEQRRADGLPAVSIAWGLWDDGMAGDLTADDRERMARSGLGTIDPELGLALFDAAVAGDRALVVPVQLELPRGADASSVPALLRELVPAAPAAAADRTSAVTALLSAPPARRPALALELVRATVAAVTGHADPACLDADRPFGELGFTSLTAIELRNQLAAATGLTLPPTLMFDHPTCAAVAKLVLAKLTPEQDATVASTAVTRLVDDPIVIVGMACRYPGGVTTPDELWQLVLDGRDAVGEFPTDRGWPVDELYHPDPSHPGTSYTRHGGFLTGAGEFDAAFFGISPREALAMDPQQRLLLETSWEALESAGIDPATLRGSRTGVYAGAMYHDYASALSAIPDGVEGFLATGTSGSVLAGRVSYALGLEGPALTVDTACSSSLVALHQAVLALQAGECDLALAGGVAVMSTAASFVEFSRQRGLAADGRCKPFSAGADGTSWGEGAGLLLVERQSDADRLGHPVLAVLRGSAVNQDGASNGLTAPNGPSQQRVLRAALAAGQVDPAEVDVIEAHGTGTSLGDPIEAQAVIDVYGQHRTEPVLLGSLKSNISHTQSAAGVGGIIKMVQAMRHGVVPATLHVTSPSPHVDWTAGAVELVTDARPWPETGHPRRAAVSSFGFSGTNAHVVLEGVPAVEPVVRPADSATTPWVLTGRTPAALRAQAARLLTHVESRTGLDDRDVAHSLVTTRGSQQHRAVILAGSAAERRLALGCLSAGREVGEVVTGARRTGGLGITFTGQGSQRAGMGRELYQALPAYRTAFDAVCAAFDGLLPAPLAEVVLGADGAANGRLHRTEFTQPALFAVETALFRVVESLGLAPSVLAGHSIGEITAAHVAGVLSLADAARLVAARGRLMQALPEGGAMLAVNAAEADVLARVGDDVDIAAVNSPTSVVLSGPADAIAAAEQTLKADGVRCKQLTVSHAFHSRLMEPMLDEFAAAIADIEFAPAQVPLVSAVTGEVVETMTAGYWVQHVRAAVRFADATTTLAGTGVSTVLELGPDAVLTAMAGETISGPVFCAAQRKDRRELDALLRALAEVHVGGHDVDWSVFTAGARTVDLPTYAFQRTRYWLESNGGQGSRTAGEDKFWQAVADRDVEALAQVLEFDEDDSVSRSAFTALLPLLGTWREQQQPAPVEVPEEADDLADLPSLAEQLADLSRDEQIDVLCDIILSQAAVVLGHAGTDELDVDGDLLDLGFTSLTAVELRNRLEVITALELPAALVYEFATAREMAEFTVEELESSAPRSE